MIMDFGFNNFGGFGGFNTNNGEETVANTSTSTNEAFSPADGFGFGGFGSSSISADDFFMSPKEAKEKKKAEEKKASAAKKTEAKKATAPKPVNDCDVTLPVQIIGRNILDTIVGEGKKKLSEIRRELLEKGYKQFHLCQMGLYYHEPSNKVYVVDSGVTRESSLDTSIGIENSVTVCDGMLQAEFNLEDFDGKEADEISLKDVIDKWVSINPSYKGCGMAYDAENNILYPCLKVLAEKDYAGKRLSISSYVSGTVTYDLEEEKEYKEFVQEVESCLTDFSTDKVKVELQYEEGDTMFVSYNSSHCYKEVSSVSVQKEKKKVEKKYELPLTLFVVTWGASYNLTSEMFEGKDKVTIDQIKEVMAEKEKMFADKSRKIDTYYDEANKKLSVMFVSGTKGCELIRSADELEKVKKMDTFHGVYCEGPVPFRIMVTMAGVFYTFLKKCIPFSLGYERKYPLIPKYILDNIVEEFRKDINKEACCRIFYDFDNNKFICKFADGFYTKTAAFYSYEDNGELLRGNKVQVVDLHSHNTMNDFFSHTDNHDDIYYGLFGVVGNLDKDEPSIELRIGAEGLYQEVPLSDIFDVA